MGPLTESGKKGHQKPNEIDNSDFDMRVFNWGADRNAVGNENALKMANHTANIANEKELMLMAKQDYEDEPTEENKLSDQVVRIEYRA